MAVETFNRFDLLTEPDRTDAEIPEDGISEGQDVGELEDGEENEVEDVQSTNRICWTAGCTTPVPYPWNRQCRHCWLTNPSC